MIKPTLRSATYFSLLATVGLWPPSIQAKGLLDAEEALQTAFPNRTDVERETFLLTEEQKERAGRLAGQDAPSPLVSRYVVRSGTSVIGYAYLDKHRVRTLPEILLIALDPHGILTNIQVLAFREPAEYMAQKGWLNQFTGWTADDEIRMKKNIDGITGATLTARAVTQSARRVMAIDRVLKGRDE